MTRERLLRLFDRWWPVPMLLLAPVAVYLNIDALGMQGIIPEYVCFKEMILAGFDLDAHTCQSETFPMWGYGWWLILTEHEVLMLLLQNLAAIGAAWFFLGVLERRGTLTGTALRVVKAALVVSIPWYAVHSLAWPYSQAVTLLLLSLGLLLLALPRADGAWWLVALSGVLFGLVLNFRSDYVALPILLAAVVVALGARRLLQAKRMALWLAATYVLLVPWALHSYAATGRPMLTSTNSGHVLYISLGQLSDNPWGITPFDGDPRMRRELEEHFGEERVSSLTAASDEYLRHRFQALVREHPRAFGRKLLHNATGVLTDGVYSGEFIEEEHCQPRCQAKYGLPVAGGERTRSRTAPLTDSRLSVMERLRYLLDQGGSVQGRVATFLGFLLVPVGLLWGALRRELELVILALVPAFQALVQIGGYQMSTYSSNVYLLLLVVAAASLHRLLGARMSGEPRPPRRSRARA